MNYLLDNISLERANSSSTAFDSGVVTENTVNAYANLFYPYIWDNGGNSQIISLTIDIFNEEELEEATDDLPNKAWITSGRMRNNLLVSKDIWGFREAFHSKKKSRSISNGFCFGGQELSFYIKPQGHGSGQIENTWLYCKTSISIIATDVINGSRSTIYTFDEFEIDSEDSSRFFQWTVPEPDSTAFSNYGLFGLQVISLEITKEYYEDAERTILFDGEVPYENQNHLQLLTYSGAKEITEVDAGDLDILVTTPSIDESLTEIFDNTIFESLSTSNLNSLTDPQKRAIVADQIAVIFISQHPVLTADFYPSQVIGAGGKAAVVPKKVVDRAITYAKRYPEIIPLVKDRLFGIFATYKAFNFVEDIESFFSDHNQSAQLIKDPLRAIVIDSNGIVDSDMGIDGIIFDPFAISVNNAEIPRYIIPSFTTTLPLLNEMVDVANITITNASGGIIEPYTSVAKISFDAISGSDNIAAIRYTLTSENSLNYAEYIDQTGLTRYHTFIFDKNFIIDPTVKGDILRAQIDIEDIEGNITSFVSYEFLQPYNESPALYDLKIYQRNDGSGVVDIFYTYEGLGEINNSYLYVQFSFDGSEWNDISIDSLKGDFENNIMPGRRRVTWEPKYDLADVDNGTPVQCRLTLYDIDSKTAIGNTLTGVLVWDTQKPTIAIRRLSVEEQIDMVNSSVSSSSSSSSSSIDSSSSSSSVDSSSSSSSSSSS